MKKVLSAVVVAAMSMSLLAGCGGSGSDSKSEGGQKSGQPVPKEAGYQAAYSSTGREADEFRELQDDDGELPF